MTLLKNLPANVGDTGDRDSISRSGRSLGEGNGNLLHYSFLENFMDRGAILSWKILWTEEPGKLQSRGSQIVGHE